MLSNFLGDWCLSHWDQRAEFYVSVPLMHRIVAMMYRWILVFTKKLNLMCVKAKAHTFSDVISMPDSITDTNPRSPHWDLIYIYIYIYVWQGAWLPRASRRLHPRKPIPVSELLFTGWPQRIEHMLQKNTREVLHLSGKYNWTWPRMDSSEVCVEIVLTWLLELTFFSFPTITVYSWSLRSCQVAASQAPQTKST